MSRPVLATASFVLSIALLGAGLVWPGGPARAATTNVEVKSDFFNAANITVNTGDTVTWTNSSFGFHTTTSRTGLWDDELAPGGSFSFTFSQAGVYNYYCQFHEFSGMVGSVTVVDTSGAPTPTATTGPTATLNGTVTLQGLTLGTAAYQVALDVRFFQPGTSTQVTTIHTTTLADGTFSVSGVTPGTYDIEVKEARRLGRIARGLTLVAGNNTKAFGDLLAGDTNGDDAVSLVDYSRMRASFGKCQGDIGFQPLADFNSDGCVSLPDYSRLRANFGTAGPLNTQ